VVGQSVDGKTGNNARAESRLDREPGRPNFLDPREIACGDS